MKEVRLLKAFGACAEAIEWLAKQKSYAAAWRTCSHGDWMLWLVGRLSGKPKSASRRKLVLAACECARLSLPIWEAKYAHDARPRRAIETAEAWARGAAGTALADVRAAAAAAVAAAASSYAADAAAAVAASSSSYAAAAAAAASSSSYAADAAVAAASSSYAAAADAAQGKTLAACADIVRGHYPSAPKLSRK